MIPTFCFEHLNTTTKLIRMPCLAPVSVNQLCLFCHATRIKKTNSTPYYYFYKVYGLSTGDRVGELALLWVN